MINKPLYVYDLETYKTCFLFCGKFIGHPDTHVFEISNRKNNKQELLGFLDYLKKINAHMIGYNNLGFDYPIVHELMTNPFTFNESVAYKLAQYIIEGQQYGFSKFSKQFNERYIDQIDLVKIWHYDNPSKRTRLKDLQFAMRSPTVVDLPYDFRKPLSSEQIDDLIKYCVHDVTETEKFANFTSERIKLRADLVESKAMSGDVLNWNDTKLGEQFFIDKLGCGRIKGTDRLVIDFKDVILPKIFFRYPEFQEVLETFKTKRWIKNDKDNNETISFKRNLGGLELAFGSGGLHASVNNKIYHESATHKIVDIDVAGMYPAVGIANNFYPEHLGEKFVDVYKQLKFDRKQHKKGSAMNSVLKLAQNGVYGKSNSEYSSMFDIKYLFSITVNGQLQNLQLFEMINSIPGVEFIQNNTDGMTMYLPRNYEWMFDQIKLNWEQMTSLELEQVEYKSMFVSDVNNYLAVKKDGSIKRIGKYWYATCWEDYDAAAGKWHMDVSMQIVAKIAEQTMIHGYNPEFLLRTMRNPFDFMIRQKVKGAQRCYIGDKETQKTLRYYVSTDGDKMKIIRPPSGELGSYKRKNKITDKLYNEVLAEVGDAWDGRIHVGKENKLATQTRYTETTSDVVSGRRVTDCCDASVFNWSNVDYDYYLEEINKLIIRKEKP